MDEHNLRENPKTQEKAVARKMASQSNVEYWISGHSTAANMHRWEFANWDNLVIMLSGIRKAVARDHLVTSVQPRPSTQMITCPLVESNFMLMKKANIFTSQCNWGYEQCLQNPLMKMGEFLLTLSKASITTLTSGSDPEFSHYFYLKPRSKR